MQSRYVVLLYMIAGCATGYHASGFGGGYSELRLSERAWQVDFSGNRYTSPERVHTFALRRAAELTLGSGYQVFYVAGENEGTEQVNIQRPVNCQTNGAFTNCYGGGVQTINKPRTRLTITMATGPEGAQAPAGSLVYDAKMLLAQIPTD